MSRASWDRRLRALEQRPSAQRPLRIVGGLPSGAALIAAMSRAASTARAPIMPEPADDPGPEPPPTESITKAREPTDSGV